jgi:hypothetical protein
MKLLLPLILLFSMAAWGQNCRATYSVPVGGGSSPTPVLTACALTVTTSTSGTVLRVNNNVQGLTPSFEYLITGSPVSVSIVMAGCKNGGTCDTLDTYATVANSIRAPTVTKVYDYFTITPTWSGGTSPTFTSNSTITLSRVNGGGGGGSGTVTSVGETFTGGLISVAGSPVTTSGTLALTVAGTSGGVPYFASSSTWASSGALTTNLPVIGGGAGAAPSVGTVTGNTTQFPTWTGATTASRCVDTDANGNLKITAGDCGASGANAALSNLSTVSINASLLAQTGVDLGATATPFRNLFLFGSGTYGSTSLELTGAPTAARTWTIQDASDTFVGRATTDTLTNKSIAGSEVNSGTILGTYMSAANLAASGNGGVTGQLPIGQVGSVGLSGTSPVTISSAGAIACATCVTSAASLTNNALMTGASGQGSQTVTTGTGVVTALGVNTGSAGAFVVNGGALGTPSSGTITSLTGTCTSCGVGGNAATVTTAASTTNSAFSILTAANTSGSQAPATVASLTVNPSTGAVNIPGPLTVASCSGCTYSGTAAMGTSAISSGTCATVVTVAQTGVTTANVISFTPTVSPNGVTGYAASASGSLYINAYPTSGNVNFLVCNNTSGSITPSALTLNWRAY